MTINSGIISLESQRAVSADTNTEITYKPTEAQEEGSKEAYEEVDYIMENYVYTVTADASS